MKTVLETIQAGSRYFEKRGIESPRLNMEHLLAHVLDCPRMDLYMDFDKPLGEEVLEPLRGLLKLRGEGEPLQHLLGTVEFREREFKCDGRALVPRPETEELVALALEELKRIPETARILDMGAGSGVIGLSLLAEGGETVGETVLADVSTDALELAKENHEQLELAPARFVQSDLFEGIDGTFHLIAANLPYIARSDAATLSPEVRCDPDSALYGGEQGTEVMSRFIAQAHPYLEPGGALVMEIGVGQAGELAKALGNAGFSDVRVAEDFSKIERFLIARA